ncbi:cathepsin B-like [Patiria miniata]|uniref:Peptidase C1A papain C-terminal domain-containing protein n=1 Tax=Patiria miniata TaxID=46514 RepID=A0A913ZMA1_PATMI|nr:cathepsin B-like [Patiria miniata]
MEYGPVSADMTLYQDLLTYRSGVYQHKTDQSIGLLAVKIIGWGVENNQKYWLCVNSWNSEWGDKDFSMKLLLAVFLGLLAAVSSSPVKSLEQNFVVYSAELVKKINSMNTTWKAGPNFAGENAASVLDRLSTPGLSREKAPKAPIITHDRAGAPPTEFDARTKWPNCPSIGRVYDQGRCNAAWALAAVGAMNDRHCITYPGLHWNFSAEDALTCNPPNQALDNNGCAAGFTLFAWMYWVQQGLVSGGGYQTPNGCRPYPYKPCDHYEKGTYGPCQAKPDSTVCNKTCVAGYPVPYEADKRKGSLYYNVGYTEADIQNEIMTYGPASVDMDLYEDLLTYRSGVYHHKSKNLLGNLAVKVIGWGVENNQKYWLCVNSWNSEWGDKGTFKILRGTFECNFEVNVRAGRMYK